MAKKTQTESPPGGKPSVYLIYGDEFLAKEKVREIVAEVLPDDLRDTNLIILDGQSLDVSHLATELFTPSLFGGPRVILVDQTTAFMGRTDQGKLLAKVVDAWKSGDRKSAVKTFGQLARLAGVSTEALAGGRDWMEELSSETPSSEQREILAAVAQELISRNKTVRGGGDDDAIEEMILSELPEETVLIFTSPAADRRKKTFKAVEKKGRIIETAAKAEKFGTGLDKSFFEERVSQALNAAGKTIRPDALAMMYARSGKDIRRLHGEVEKLVSYLGERKQVTVADVDALFSDSHEAAFYELTNALRTADLGTCLKALDENLKIVDHPLQTLGAIASDVRKLIAARELLFTAFRSHWRPGLTYRQFQDVATEVRAQNPSLLGKGKFQLLSTLKDYPLLLLLKDVQKFPLDKLVLIMEAVLEADIMMKSSSLGHQAPRAILENLVMTICAPAAPAGRK